MCGIFQNALNLRSSAVKYLQSASGYDGLFRAIRGFLI